MAQSFGDEYESHPFTTGDSSGPDQGTDGAAHLETYPPFEAITDSFQLREHVLDVQAWLNDHLARISDAGAQTALIDLALYHLNDVGTSVFGDKALVVEGTYRMWQYVRGLPTSREDKSETMKGHRFGRFQFMSETVCLPLTEIEGGTLDNTPSPAFNRIVLGYSIPLGYEEEGSSFLGDCTFRPAAFVPAECANVVLEDEYPALQRKQLRETFSANDQVIAALDSWMGDECLNLTEIATLFEQMRDSEMTIERELEAYVAYLNAMIGWHGERVEVDTPDLRLHRASAVVPIRPRKYPSPFSAVFLHFSLATDIEAVLDRNVSEGELQVVLDVSTDQTGSRQIVSSVAHINRLDVLE